MLNEQSVKEYEKIFEDSKTMEEYHLDACYLVNGENIMEFVAGSIMALEKSETSEFEWKELYEIVKTQEMLKLIKSTEYMTKLCNVRAKYNLDKYFAGRGFCVAQNYRRLGLAEEILKARVKVCHHYGVPITGAWMSSLASQKAAAKVGWETIYELNYDELEKAVEIKFDPSTPPTCNLMIFKS